MAHEIWVKFISNQKKNMSCTKSQQRFFRKRESFLTDLKVPFLTCTCVFYQPENNTNGKGGALKFQKKEGKPMELKFDGLEIRNWNIPTNRAQVVDEKIGIICWFIYHVYYSWSYSYQLYFQFLFSSFRKWCGILDSELPVA